MLDPLHVFEFEQAKEVVVSVDGVGCVVPLDAVPFVIMLLAVSVELPEIEPVGLVPLVLNSEPSETINAGEALVFPVQLTIAQLDIPVRLMSLPYVL